MARRIEICGGMASGKTTLAALLEDIASTVSYEKFSKVPFWKEFYADPGRFAFETEIGFLLQHYHQIKLAMDTAEWVVCDFSLIQDRAYAEVNLTGSQKQAFLAVYDEIHRELGQPDLIVHLACGEKEELRRVRARARRGESQMTLEYLSKVNAAISRLIPSLRVRHLLKIDSESVNFAEHAADKEAVVQTIKSTIGI
jgi:deoxyadenosine/deoxycytidine kinase